MPGPTADGEWGAAVTAAPHSFSAVSPARAWGAGRSCPARAPHRCAMQRSRARAGTLGRVRGSSLGSSDAADSTERVGFSYAPAHVGCGARAGDARRAGVPRARHRGHRGQERGAARRRRPARRADAPRSSPPTPGTSRPRRPPAWRPARSTGCASPRPGSRRWPPVCARSPRSPTRWARSSSGWVRPERPRDPAGAGPARRRGDHLREPPQRHVGRRRPLRQGRERRAAAGERHAPSSRTSRSRRRCGPASPRPGCPRTP